MKRRYSKVSVLCAVSVTAAMLMGGTVQAEDAASAAEAAVESVVEEAEDAAEETAASAAEEVTDAAEEAVTEEAAGEEAAAEEATEEATEEAAGEEAAAEEATEEAAGEEAAAEEATEEAAAEEATEEAAGEEAPAEEATEETADAAESVAEDAAADEAEDAEAAEEEAAEEEPERVHPEYRGLDYITLGDYTGLTLEVEPIEITDAAIDTRIDTDIQYSEEGSETFTEGTVAEGDVANIDFEGKKDGVAFEGGTAEGYDLEIGSGSFIAGFEEGLIGVAVGDTVDLDLTFPEDYGNEELAGQAVVFTVKVNSVKRYKELDDELAKALSDGEAETVDAYRERTRTMLEEEALEQRNETAKTQLLAMAADGSEISEYPQDLLDYTVEDITNYYKSYASMYGVDFATFLSAMVGTTEEDFPALAEQIAKESVKQELTVGAIAEQESLLPEGDELAKAYDALAAEVGAEDGVSLVAEYGEYTVNYRLKYDAVGKLLLENAVITEKEPAAAVESGVAEAESVAEASGAEVESVAEPME